MIPIVDRFAQLEPPTKGFLLKAIEKKGFTKDQILGNAAPTAKDQASLAANNFSNRDFEIWVYDLYWCYQDADAATFIDKNGSMSSPYMDIIRMTDKDRQGNSAINGKFQKFQDFKSTSGYFAVFIEFTDKGKSDRQFIDIYNLFDPVGREMEVRNSLEEGKTFHVEFTR